MRSGIAAVCLTAPSAAAYIDRTPASGSERKRCARDGPPQNVEAWPTRPQPRHERLAPNRPASLSERAMLALHGETQEHRRECAPSVCSTSRRVPTSGRVPQRHGMRERPRDAGDVVPVRLWRPDDLEGRSPEAARQDPPEPQAPYWNKKGDKLGLDDSAGVYQQRRSN
jgi:hypothetical protein